MRSDGALTKGRSAPPASENKDASESMLVPIPGKRGREAASKPVADRLAGRKKAS
jgi:hypothetical protein